MTETPEENWERLGRFVKMERNRRPEFRDTKAWAAAVGRSTRQMLGLERGEKVGDATLLAIDRTLGWPADQARRILTNSDGVFTDPAPVADEEPERPVDLRSDLTDDELIEHLRSMLDLARRRQKAVESRAYEVERLSRKVDEYRGVIDGMLRLTAETVALAQAALARSVSSDHRSDFDLAARTGQVQIGEAEARQAVAGEESQDPEDGSQ